MFLNIPDAFNFEEFDSHYLTINCKCHLSGHGKFETLGALGISSVLLLTAGGIAWHALDVLVVYFYIRF